MVSQFPSLACSLVRSPFAAGGGADRVTHARRDPESAGREPLSDDHIVADILSSPPLGRSNGHGAGQKPTSQVGRDHGVSLNRLSTGPLAPQDTRVIDAVAK